MGLSVREADSDNEIHPTQIIHSSSTKPSAREVFSAEGSKNP